MQDGQTLLLTIIILLALATALGALFERLGQSAILGYLAAGVLAGPGGFHWIGEEVAVDQMAELGVALLLFTIGLEFSLHRLRALGKFAALGGMLQILLTIALFTAGALALGVPMRMALAVGVLVAPSSTACVLRLLGDRAELDSIHGRNATGVLLLQDLALVPLVLVIATLGGEGDWEKLFGDLVLAAAVFVALVCVFYLATQYLLSHALRAAAMLRNRELLMLLAATLALGSIWAAHAVHVSPALGAFLAGLMIAGSPFAPQLRADIAPLRTLFVTLFFISVGMLADLRWLGANLLPILAVVAAILLGKALVIAPLALAFRNRLRDAVATGIVMAQIGEFSFVLGGLALAGGVLNDQVFQMVVSATLMTMFLTPFLVRLAIPAGRACQEGWRRFIHDARLEMEAAQREAGLTDHVIVVGYGPAGRQVIRKLVEREIHVIVLDLNPLGLLSAREQGLATCYGDATQADILEQAHLASARALVVTLPDHGHALQVVRQAAALAPQTPIFTRSRYNKYVAALNAAGSRVTVDEEECIGAVLAEHVTRYPEEFNP